MVEKISWKTIEKYLAGIAWVVGECPNFFCCKMFEKGSGVGKCPKWAVSKIY